MRTRCAATRLRFNWASPTRRCRLTGIAEVLDLKVTSGDRAPDAPGLNAKGEAIRLFDVFRGPHFTLLRLFGPDGQMSASEWRGVKCVDVRAAPKSNDGGEVYGDVFGHFASAYGAGKGEYLLVRPDGYIGWIGFEENLPDLQRYLAGILPR